MERYCFKAPPGSYCIKCGANATGSHVRKAIYEPNPDANNYGYKYGRIKLVGFGWQCGNECKPVVYKQGELF